MSRQPTPYSGVEQARSATYSVNSDFFVEGFTSNYLIVEAVEFLFFRSKSLIKKLFKASETYETAQEKRRLKRSKGKPRLFTASDFHYDEATQTCRCPAGNNMWRSGINVNSYNQHYTRFCGYLKDCKVCSLQQQCMRKPPIKTGRQVQFKHNDTRKKQSYLDKMKVKIDSPIGRRQYSKRLGTIEPVFGNITVNKGMNKLTLRGQEKVNAQWQMYCLVHNIEKLRNSLH